MGSSESKVSIKPELKWECMIWETYYELEFALKLELNSWEFQQLSWEIAAYSNRMDSTRLYITQSNLEMLGKQIGFLFVRTPSLPKKFVWRVCWKFLALSFLDLLGVHTLWSWVLWLWTGFWFHLHTLSLHFQLQILFKCQLLLKFMTKQGSIGG